MKRKDPVETHNRTASGSLDKQQKKGVVSGVWRSRLYLGVSLHKRRQDDV